VAGDTRPLIIDGHGSHITYAFVKFCVEHSILLLCLPSHSTHLLQPLDVGLFSPYHHFYGLAVDNHMRSGRQTGDGIKKAIFLCFVTEAREKTFTLQNISCVFEACGIWPLCARKVLGKMIPEAVARRDTMGLITTPRQSKDIRRRIMATGKMLDESLASLSLTESALPSPSGPTLAGSSERLNLDIKVILREPGHQLETEVAQRELFQELSYRLRRAAPLKNYTNSRKLSEARILSGVQLIDLRDARLKKDAGKGHKLPKGTLKTKRVLSQRLVKIITTRTEIPGSSARWSTDDSEVEVLSDEEWNLASESNLVSRRTTRAKPCLSSSTPSGATVPPLHMSLRSRKT